jgi:flagellar protein FlaG
MEVGGLKVTDNAQELAKMIIGGGRPVTAEAEKPVVAESLKVAPVKEASAITEITETQQKKEVESLEQLKPTMQALNHFLEFMSADIRFQIHEKTNQMYVQLVSEKDNKVLRQYPPKEFLDMVARIREFVGIFLDKKA